MARYVILAFDSNKEAEAFIAAVDRNEAGEGNHVLFTTPHTTLPDQFSVVSFKQGVTVRGLYMKPTDFCSCAEVGPFTRGTKFGLWVHAKCGKPTKVWASGDHWYASMGKNLLPVTERAPEWRGEGIAHHYWDAATRTFRHVETNEPWNPPTR